MKFNVTLHRLAWVACLAGLPAFAQFTPIPLPNAAYTGGTKLIAITVPDGTVLNSITGGGAIPETAGFSAPLTAGTVPGGGWATWNSPPFVESNTPRVLINGVNTLTLTLSHPVAIFGFEVEPNDFGTHTFTATFLSGAATVGTITENITGNSGALLAGAASQPGLITSVVVSTDAGAGGFAIAQLRFRLPDPTMDSPFQIRYSANLNSADSVINITNSGANGASPNGPGFGGAAGNLCVNVYAFSPDEQLVSCCSCLITPNGLASLSVQNDLISNTLTGVRPNSVVVKLVGTLAGPTATGTSCTNSAALAGTPAFPLATGMLAWGTTTHAAVAAGAFASTETGFTPSTLSGQELASINNRCTNIIGNGSTFGICRSCRVGALGAGAAQ